ncbi:MULTISPECIES: alginate lyase family protein [unclassified Sulfitobacter]|uniref:heparinase II/III family protein n=1 Tax=unclassified Sulfitobacter TaxID=196795 RepID=UPI003745939B
MSRYGLIARTAPKLGLRNVARVALYRARFKSGWRPRPPDTPCPEGAVYGLGDSDRQGGSVTLKLFGWYPVELGAAPDWHADPFGAGTRQDTDVDWVAALQRIGDGDVKRYWELSRFYWLPQFALAARDGDADAATRIENWLRDWVDANPSYRGINWACGQEASIRLMNLALAALILDTWRDPSPTMRWLVEAHARRIRPTLSYALGQDNNHGTAEACGIYVAGSWGKRWSMPDADRCARTGLRWLNDRALRMIQADGSPCQYSTTYHRANLEGFCLAGLWAEKTGAPRLGTEARSRILDGARWLQAIVDPATGDAPNLGPNDGSHLFTVSQADYRDFRPTVALAAVLFDDERPWPDYDDPRVSALGLKQGDHFWPSPTSRSSDVGGYHVLRVGQAMAVLRYPRFRYRPSQADALHLDLWHAGRNLLRDGGTFSYNAEGAEWFAGTAAHNTIEFDGRDQMPRLGRFLFGDWLKAEAVEPVLDDGVKAVAAAAYTDARGARHHRAITLSAGSLICRDTISGNFEVARLRWRLAPGEWHIEGDIVRNGAYSIAIEFDGVPVSPALGTTVESRYYLQKTEIPEISVKVSRPGTLVTKVTF